MKAAIKTTVICAMFTMAGCADKAAEQQQMARAAAINKNGYLHYKVGNGKSLSPNRLYRTAHPRLE